jgi:hypothetical protein
MSTPPSRSSRGRLAGVSALALALLACGGGDRPLRRAHRPPLVPAALGRPAIDWLRSGERIVVGEGGVAAGPPSGPLARAAFRSPEEADDLRFFAGSFAPFVEAAGGERLAFAGRGSAPASAPERRMIREWARQAAAGGSGGGAYGLALAWRGGPLACEGVSVFLSGEVRAGACDWRQEARGRLAGEPLARLYRWFDAYRPFQVDSLEAGRAALAASGLIFAGGGGAAAPAAERAAMSDFAAALHRELAARRAAPLPPPLPAGPQPAAAKPPAPSLPGPGLVRPDLLRPDLPPPAPATTPIVPIAAPAAPAAPTDADQEIPPGTSPSTPSPPRRAKPKPAPVQEEDEAPLQGTEPAEPHPPSEDPASS